MAAIARAFSQKAAGCRGAGSQTPRMRNAFSGSLVEVDETPDAVRRRMEGTTRGHLRPKPEASRMEPPFRASHQVIGLAGRRLLQEKSRTVGSVAGSRRVRRSSPHMGSVLISDFANL